MRSNIEFIFRPIDRWPQEPTPRHQQTASPFRTNYSKTIELLEYELGRLGVKRAYVQADVTESDIRLDGHLRADAKIRSSRVIIAAQTKHGPITLPCDTYNHWQDNIRAIALALEALRKVDRYGVTKRGEQYRGLKQITAGDGPINSPEAAAFVAKYCHATETVTHRASDILASATAFEVCYREATKKLHPDVASEELRGEWDKLQRAAAILRDHFAPASR